jgi:aryl-alcohol dehydrogenase
MQINAAVVNAPREPFSIETLELEEPRDDEVFIRVIAAGMSRVDLRARDQDILVPLPAVLGCEGVGRVERRGAKVMSLAPWDRVVFTHASGSYPPFGRRISQFRAVEFAALHRSGQPIAGSFFGQGCFATHVVTQEQNLIKVPDDDTPLPVLAAIGGDVQAGASAVIETLRPRPGSSIAIFGVGAAGFGAVMAARLTGCHPIIAVDIKASRLDLAEQLGVTHTIDPDGPEPVAAVRNLAADGVEFAVETTGDPQLASRAIECLAPRGTCVLCGVGKSDADLVLKHSLMMECRTVVGNPFGTDDPAYFVPRLIGLYRRGGFPVDRLVAEFRFDEINSAADALLSGAAVKPVLIMP